MSKKFSGRWLSGKGYYIALILCAAAIGISGYVYYHDKTPDSLNGEVANVAATGGDVAVAGSAPVQDAPAGNNATQPQKEAKLKTASPVEGETISPYAMECLSYNATTRDWRTHDGVDIAAEAGTQVRAAADGTVYTTFEDDTMGHTVVIRHEGGYTTVYSSLDGDLPVSAGDTVKLGDVIGTVSNSALVESEIGNHVHFSVTCNDESVDPAEFLTLGE